jgi:hypothetical protein
MLAVGPRPGGPFKRVDEGTYTLAEEKPESTTRGPSRRTRSWRGPRQRQSMKPAA